ncbi:MAG: hypothetical protein ABSH38_01055 [Verrucomicrobiota bacterium]|jgi:alpha-tubulin suppressor-like RCC1 family protein
MSSIFKLLFAVFILLLLPANPGYAAVVTNVAAGDYWSFFLKSDGSLWAMGENWFGQLGDGTENTSITPEQIRASGVTEVSGGGSQTLVLESDGSLWGMGDNSGGELGLGPNIFWELTPTLVIPGNVNGISAGEYHSLFFKTDGSLWGMGDNDDGSLGDGTTNTSPNPFAPHVTIPEEIVSNNVTAVASGFDHSLFLKADGSLWAMGYDESGELGDGQADIGTNTPIEIVSSNVTAIAAGNNHSLFLKSDGSLWAMGDNEFGQLGDGTPNSACTIPEKIVSSNVTAIVAKGDFSLFLKSDGSLWGMGDDSHGQLGTTGLINPVFNPTPQEIITNGVIAVAAGQQHVIFLKVDHSVWTMGMNNYSQLGNGTNTDSYVPVEIVSGIAIPAICSISLSGPNLVLNGSNGQAGATYCVLMSSNLTKPLRQWTAVSTNALSAPGDFSIIATNAVNPGRPQQFYVLQMQ